MRRRGGNIPLRVLEGRLAKLRGVVEARGGNSDCGTRPARRVRSGAGQLDMFGAADSGEWEIWVTDLIVPAESWQPPHSREKKFFSSSRPSAVAVRRAKAIRWAKRVQVLHRPPTGSVSTYEFWEKIEGRWRRLPRWEARQ